MRSISLLAGASVIAFASGCGSNSDEASKPLELGIPPTAAERMAVPGGRQEPAPITPAANPDSPKVNDAQPFGGGSTVPRPTTARTPAPTTTTPPAPNFRPPVPPRRERKAADETVSRRYQAASGSLAEIEGVCRFTDGPISCWKVDGSPNPELEQRFKAAMDRQASYGSNMLPSAQVAIGHKNRLVVVRTLTEMAKGPSGYLRVASAGKQEYGGYSGIHLETDRTALQRGQMVNFQTITAAEAASASTTSVRLELTEPLSESKDLDCKVGASVMLGGQKIMVASIKEGAPVPGMSMGGERNMKVWTVQLSVPANGQLQFGFQPVAKSGAVIPYVDDKGQPMTLEEMNKRQEEAFRNRSSSGSAVPSPAMRTRPATMTHVNRDGKFACVLAVDPGKVAKLRVSGSKRRIIDITGIPMDPKR